MVDWITHSQQSNNLFFKSLCHMLTKHKIQTPTDTNETLLKLETGNTICPPAILSECFSAVITVLKQLPSVAGWRWRRCEQTSHQDTLHGASSNHGRQSLAPSCHADYWLRHIPQSCDSTYHEAPLSAPESLTPGMGLPWHEITILAMYDLRVMGAAVCNHTSSIFGHALFRHALFGHALFKNLHCNVSIMLWSPSGYQAGAITILGVCCGTELSCDNFTSQLCYLTPGETWEYWAGMCEVSWYYYKHDPCNFMPQ